MSLEQQMFGGPSLEQQMFGGQNLCDAMFGNQEQDVASQMFGSQEQSLEDAMFGGREAQQDFAPLQVHPVQTAPSVSVNVVAPNQYDIGLNYADLNRVRVSRASDLGSLAKLSGDDGKRVEIIVIADGVAVGYFDQQ